MTGINMLAALSVDYSHMRTTHFLFHIGSLPLDLRCLRLWVLMEGFKSNSFPFLPSGGRYYCVYIFFSLTSAAVCNSRSCGFPGVKMEDQRSWLDLLPGWLLPCIWYMCGKLGRLLTPWTRPHCDETSGGDALTLPRLPGVRIRISGRTPTHSPAGCVVFYLVSNFMSAWCLFFLWKCK